MFYILEIALISNNILYSGQQKTIINAAAANEEGVLATAGKAFYVQEKYFFFMRAKDLPLSVSRFRELHVGF